MFENLVSGGRLLAFNVGDWILLMSGCLVSGFLAFLMLAITTVPRRFRGSTGPRHSAARAHSRFGANLHERSSMPLVDGRKDDMYAVRTYSGPGAKEPFDLVI